MIETKVGSKGELFLPKSIRRKLGYKPGDKVFFEVSDGILIVRKVSDLLELLQKPSIGKAITPNQIEEELEKIQQQQIKESLDDSS